MNLVRANMEISVFSKLGSAPEISEKYKIKFSLITTPSNHQKRIEVVSEISDLKSEWFRQWAKSGAAFAKQFGYRLADSR